jgi:hypothetical protein
MGHSDQRAEPVVVKDGHLAAAINETGSRFEMRLLELERLKILALCVCDVTELIVDVGLPTSNRNH